MKFFRESIQIARSSYLSIISISSVILAILIVYWQDFSILVNEAFQNEAVSHIILIPFLVFYLIYRKRELAKASFALEKFRGRAQLVSFSDVVGAAFCLSAFLLYWYSSYTFYALEYHVVSLLVFIFGVILILTNIKTLIVLIFPILFLLFLILPPSNITLYAGALLGNFNAQASYTLLGIMGVPVTLSSEYGSPTVIINNPSERPLEFAVDLPCSGIYSLVAFTMFATFLAYFVRGSITKKAALFPLGFLILLILNVFRISLIAFVAYRFGEGIAMTLFHIFSGWFLIFFGILLLLLIAEKLLHLQIFRGRKEAPSCSKSCVDRSKIRGFFCPNCGRLLKNHQTKISKRSWVKITALLLASYILTLCIRAPVFAFAQGLTIANSNPETSIDIFPQVEDYQLKFLYRDIDFEKISRQDASLVYAYLPTNISTPTVYMLIGVAGSIANLHSWEVCFLTWRIAHGYLPSITVLESRDIQIMQNPPITARYLVFQNPANYTQLTLYWYQKALFKTGITIVQKYTRISLVILTQNPNNSSEFEQKLLKIGELIAAHWEPLKTQSFVSLGVPTIQVLLGSTLVFAVGVQTTQCTREWKRKTTNLKIFEKMASQEEKLLYQTIKELSQKTKETTGQKIASTFEKATGKAVKPNELIEMLDNLERQGILKADIVNILDQPRLVWKT